MSSHRSLEVANEVRQLVAEDEVRRALNRLMDLANDYGLPRRNDAVLLSNRYTHYEKDLHLLGHGADAQRARNELVSAILALADDLTEAASVPEATVGHYRKHRAPASAAVLTNPTVADSTSASTPLVYRAEHLSKLRRATDPRFSLEDISFELSLGRIVALVGPNGNGKTTLMELIAGRIPKDSGEISYPILSASGLVWREIKRRIAFVPQQSELPHGQTERYLRFVAALHGATGAENDAAVETMLERLGLGEFRKANSHELSGGYKARFALAAALLKRPLLLLLDEPLAHLDKNAQVRFLQDIRDLACSVRHPFAAVVSSQHLHEIESISDSTLYLEDGRLKYYGPTRSFRATRVTDTYEVLCDAGKDELAAALRALGEITIERLGPYFAITVPREITIARLAQDLERANVQVEYVRSIGSSSRFLMSTGGASS